MHHASYNVGQNILSFSTLTHRMGGIGELKFLQAPTWQLGHIKTPGFSWLFYLCILADFLDVSLLFAYFVFFSDIKTVQYLVLLYFNKFKLKF